MTAMTEADWGRIFAKAWSDAEFRSAYEADPRAAVKKWAGDLNIDPNAKFTFPSMPDHIDDAKAKAIAEGDAEPEPMYCC